MKLCSCFALLILVAALGVPAGTALGQSYPTRPVRIVVPYPAGGSVDTIARLMSPKMADSLGQPVLVENRPGAAARIGHTAVIRSAPDGYTILMDASGIAIGPSLYRKQPYNVTTDLIPVSQIVATTNLLAASPNFGATSIKEFIALAKAKSKSLNYGHTGVGTSLQMAFELFRLAAGIELTGIPYKGDALVSNALMASEVDVGIVTLPTNIQNVKVGRLRALGVSGSERSRLLPDVPTWKESGVDAEYVSWYGMFVPANTPSDIVMLIQREAAKALAVPDVRDRILALGLDPVGSTPADFGARFKADIVKFAKLIKEAGIPQLD